MDEIKPKIKRPSEEECVLDIGEGINTLEVFATEKFSVMAIDYFGQKVYRIRKLEQK